MIPWPLSRGFGRRALSVFIDQVFFVYRGLGFRVFRVYRGLGFTGVRGFGVYGCSWQFRSHPKPSLNHLISKAKL